MNNIEQVLASTFYLEVDTDEGTIIGTGFFCQFELSNGNNAVALLSCRHILEGANCVKLWVPLASTSGAPSLQLCEIRLELNKQAISHPDPSVDLAACIIHHIEHALGLHKALLFYRSIPTIHIPNHLTLNDISVGDEIFIVGSPGGMHDKLQKFPFVRKGVIANLPKFLETKEFYVDAPTYSGSSGSPVIIDSHISFNRENGSYEMRSRFYLIGMICNGLEEHDEEGNRVDLHFGKAVRSDAFHEVLAELCKSYGLE